MEFNSKALVLILNNTVQKKIVSIIVGTKLQIPCRDLFKKLQFLLLPCEYTFSLLNFVINNLAHFPTNSTIHCVNTRHNHHLHRPVANVTCFQKSTYYSCINIFSNLPSSHKSLMSEKAKFKIALKRYLNTHSFYSVDEFLLPKLESAS
jgi:hypothetical protein